VIRPIWPGILSFSARDTRCRTQCVPTGATPYLQIDPTFASVSAIAAGTYDDNYRRPYAGSIRDFGHPVVIGSGHEMNATWYTWGYKHVRASTFVAAWRHIVTLFNDEGAKNVTWLWTINQDQRGTGPIASWWPGTRSVTWIGIDGYYFNSSDTFDSVHSRGSTTAALRSKAGDGGLAWC
jgi:beta-mannanase